MTQATDPAHHEPFRTEPQFTASLCPSQDLDRHGNTVLHEEHLPTGNTRSHEQLSQARRYRDDRVEPTQHPPVEEIVESPFEVRGEVPMHRRDRTDSGTAGREATDEVRVVSVGVHDTCRRLADQLRDSTDFGAIAPGAASDLVDRHPRVSQS